MHKKSNKLQTTVTVTGSGPSVGGGDGDGSGGVEGDVNGNGDANGDGDGVGGEEKLSDLSLSLSDQQLLEEYRTAIDTQHRALYEEKVFDLSVDQMSDKQRLLAEGFISWSKKDFKSFLEVRGCVCRCV